MHTVVLNKNENIINAGCWVLSENCKKIIPSKKNQSVLIAKISSRKTQKIANPQKFHATQYVQLAGGELDR